MNLIQLLVVGILESDCWNYESHLSLRKQAHVLSNEKTQKVRRRTYYLCRHTHTYTAQHSTAGDRERTHIRLEHTLWLCVADVVIGLCMGERYGIMYSLMQSHLWTLDVDTDVDGNMWGGVRLCKARWLTFHIYVWSVCINVPSPSRNFLYFFLYLAEECDIVSLYVYTERWFS